MEDHHHLFQPLIPTTTTTDATAATAPAATVPSTISPTSFLSHTNPNKIPIFISSKLNIFFRLVFIMLIGLISIWANHEASKGFAITTVNDSGDSPAGKRFSLFYQSNDEATRAILRASKFVEKIIYFNETHPKKQINHIILRLAGRKLAHTVLVNSGENSHEFILNLCPSTIEGTNFREATSLAVLRGMAHIWLWGGPREIVNGIVEYIVNRAVVDSGASGSPESDFCRKSGDQIITVAKFLNYCERRSVGFIGRLNRGMKNGWDEQTVDDALGMPAQHLCGSHIFFKIQ